MGRKSKQAIFDSKYNAKDVKHRGSTLSVSSAPSFASRPDCLHYAQGTENHSGPVCLQKSHNCLSFELWKAQATPKGDEKGPRVAHGDH